MRILFFITGFFLLFQSSLYSFDKANQDIDLNTYGFLFGNNASGMKIQLGLNDNLRSSFFYNPLTGLAGIGMKYYFGIPTYPILYYMPLIGGFYYNRSSDEYKNRFIRPYIVSRFNYDNALSFEIAFGYAFNLTPSYLEGFFKSIVFGDGHPIIKIFAVIYYGIPGSVLYICSLPGNLYIAPESGWHKYYNDFNFSNTLRLSFHYPF